VQFLIWGEPRPRILLLYQFHFGIAQLEQSTREISFGQVTSIFDLLVSQNLIIIEEHEDGSLEAIGYDLVVL